MFQQPSASASPKLRAAPVGIAASLRPFSGQEDITRLRYSSMAASPRSHSAKMQAQQLQMPTLPERPQGNAMFRPEPIMGQPNSLSPKPYSFSAGSFDGSNFGGHHQSSFRTTQTNAFARRSDDPMWKRYDHEPSFSGMATNNHASKDSTKHRKTMMFESNAFPDHATVTPDEMPKQSVEIKNPSHSLFLDGTEQKKAPSGLPSKKRHRSNSQSMIPGRNKKFDGTCQDGSEPLPFAGPNDGASLLDESGLQQETETLLKADEDSVKGLTKSIVYQTLRPLLPLPMALTPIVHVLLIMEASKEDKDVVQCACHIVCEEMQHWKPGKNDKNVSGEIFEQFARNLSNVVDISKYFYKAQGCEMLDKAVVRNLFFGGKEGPRGPARPSFTPTNLQIALAYAIVKSKKSKRMNFEDFVKDASAKLENMAILDKINVWNAAAKLFEETKM